MGFYAGQDYLKSQLNWAVAGRLAGLGVQAVRARGRARGRLLASRTPSTATRRTPSPTAAKVVNEGPGDGNDYGSAISLTHGDRGVGQHRVRRPHPVDAQRPAEDPEDGRRRWASRANAPGPRAQLAASRSARRRSARSTWPTPTRTIADGGSATTTWFIGQEGDPLLGRQGALPRAAETRPGAAPTWTSTATSATPSSRWSRHGTGRTRRRCDRPAAGKTGTATNADGDVSSSWFVGYTPQVSHRGDVRARQGQRGAQRLPAVSYFGADYPTRTWTAVMQAILEGAPVGELPAGRRTSTAKRTDHAATPTYTPAADPDARAEARRRRRRRRRPPTTPTPSSSAPPPTASAPSRRRAEPEPQRRRQRRADATDRATRRQPTCGP